MLNVFDTCYSIVHNQVGQAGTGITPNCGNYVGGDQWYYIEIPSTGFLQINAQGGSNSGADIDMAIYNGESCGTLTLITCDENSNSGNSPKIILENYPAGTPLYIQLFENGNDHNASFSLCIYSEAPENNIVTPIVGGTGANCSEAVPFCTDNNYVFPNNIGTTAPSGPDYGCLGTQPNPIWYYFQVETPGDLQLSISQTSSSTGNAIDIDFITYGPFTNLVQSCQQDLTAGNTIDCSYSTTATELVDYPNLQSGELYIVLMTNFSNQEGNISFTKTNGTATTNCAVATPCPFLLGSYESCPTVATGYLYGLSLGIAPYTYYWLNNTGDTLQQVQNINEGDTLFTVLPGEYELVVINGDGCQYSNSITVNHYIESYFSYPDTLHCIHNASILPDSIRQSGGVFSVLPNSLTIDSNTGEIDVSTANLSEVYTIYYITNGICGVDTSFFELSFSDTTISSFFSFDTTAFCNNKFSPLPDSITQSQHANFYSIPGTLPLNPITGQLNLNPYISGVFDVYNVTRFGCFDTTIFTVQIDNGENAYFSYAFDTICKFSPLLLPDSISSVGGYFTSNLITVDSLTGELNTQTSLPNSIVSVNYTTSGHCNSTASTVFYVKPLSSHFSYAINTICTNGTNIQPNNILNPSGYFYTLNSAIELDSITGEINITNSSLGVYDIIRVVNDDCFDSTIVTLTIIDPPSPAFTYAQSSFCKNATNPAPNFIATSGGIFSATPTGMSINSSTGLINLASTTVGTYSIRYITPLPCRDTSFVEIQVLEVASANFSYPFDLYCSNGESVLPNSITTPGGVFSAPSGVAINTSTGAINMATSTPGTYTISYTTSGVCPATSVFTMNIHPDMCVCNANAGNFNATINGISQVDYILCYGDQLQIFSTGNFIPPTEILGGGANDPGYNPGLGLLVYDCMPSIFPPDGINDDPCLLGIISVGTTWNITNSYTNGITLYYVPVTLYNISTLTYSYITEPADLCYDIGEIFTVVHLPRINSTFTQNCLTNTVTASVSGGLPSNNGSTFSVTNVLPSGAIATPTIINNGGTTQISTVTNGMNFGFTLTDTLGCYRNFLIGPFTGIPEANAGSDSLICSLEGALNAISPPFGTGLWLSSDGIVIDDSSNPQSTFLASSNGTYPLIWTTQSSTNCVDRDTIILTISELSFAVDANNTNCNLANGSLEINILSGISPYTFSLDNNATTQTNPLFVNLNASEYTITVNDSFNCISHQTITLQSEEGECELVFYSGLTPNGDGLNDEWIIDGLPEGNHPAIIFNRWGDIVWKTETYDNTTHVWLGKNEDGAELPTGVYFYAITIKDLTYKGFIELTR
jgi:gliding motility-associated-like protein